MLPCWSARLDAEDADDGLRQAILDAARPYKLRIVGPDCLGVMAPAAGLNASFAHVQPKPGHLAFIAQSGAVVTSVLDWATTRDIGFSHVVSLGDMWDVDFGDVLDYLTGEGEVRGILLYIETVTHARKFMSAARAAARLKPVVVDQGRPASGGRPRRGRRAAIGERDALYDDQVYDAAFRRAGMLRVKDIGDLFDIVETLGMTHAPMGDRLAILTNGGGIGVMAVDALLDGGGRLATSEPGDAGGARRLPAADLVARQSGRHPRRCAWRPLRPRAGPAARGSERRRHSGAEGADGTRQRRGGGAARRSPPSARAASSCSPAGWATRRRSRRAGCSAAQHIPTYFTPEQAVRAFIDMLQYRRNQEALMQTPPSVPEDFEPDIAAARRGHRRRAGRRARAAERAGGPGGARRLSHPGGADPRRRPNPRGRRRRSGGAGRAGGR